jgi:kynurenine formamidase
VASVSDRHDPEFRQRWGADDQTGAANELHHELVFDAARAVTSGRIVDLSQPISAESPRLPVVQSPYSLCLWSNPQTGQLWYREERGATNEVSFADERVTLDLHTGTHIDALAHTWVGDRTYNGFRFDEVVGNWGLRRLGIEHLPPLVCSGLLLDLVAPRGRELDAGELISPEDLEAALERQHEQIRGGDIVLIRTGWARYYGTDNHRYVGDSPGIGIAAARWLTEQGVIAVGADTMGLEVYPPEEPGVLYPVHQHLLARTGTYIIEQAALEEIGSLGIHRFLCICAAVKFVGASASPIRLTAVL